MKNIIFIVCFMLSLIIDGSEIIKVEAGRDSVQNGEWLTSALAVKDVKYILLGQGVYRGNFVVEHDLSLIGGYTGDSVYWPPLTTNDSHLTILHGHENIDDPFILKCAEMSENEFCHNFADTKNSAVLFVKPKEQVILSSCTITGGRGMRLGDIQLGGGVSVDSMSNSCLIENCTVEYNIAAFGGGILGATLKNSLVKNNFASHSGGGSCGTIAEKTCFYKNWANGYGGGSIGEKSNLSSFIYNRASFGGGASGVFVENVLFYGNMALQGCACQCEGDSAFFIKNIVFSDSLFFNSTILTPLYQDNYVFYLDGGSLSTENETPSLSSRMHDLSPYIDTQVDIKMKPASAFQFLNDTQFNLTKSEYKRFIRLNNQKTLHRLFQKERR